MSLYGSTKTADEWKKSFNFIKSRVKTKIKNGTEFDHLLDSERKIFNMFGMKWCIRANEPENSCDQTGNEPENTSDQTAIAPENCSDQTANEPENSFNTFEEQLFEIEIASTDALEKHSFRSFKIDDETGCEADSACGDRDVGTSCSVVRSTPGTAISDRIITIPNDEFENQSIEMDEGTSGGTTCNCTGHVTGRGRVRGGGRGGNRCGVRGARGHSRLTTMGTSRGKARGTRASTIRGIAHTRGTGLIKVSFEIILL